MALVSSMKRSFLPLSLPGLLGPLAFAWVLALTLGGTLAAPASASEPAYRVVVHPDSPAAEFLTRRQLSQIFLGKLDAWPNGVGIEIVELESRAAARVAFSHDIHDRSLENIRSHWQRQVMAGRRLPPASAATDREVLELVRRQPGAIGYISSESEPVGVREIGIAAEPILVREVSPIYPDVARRAQVEGLVVLEIEVDESGRVGSVEPRNRLPHGLTAEAIRAVRRFRYEPATYEGRPVPAWVEVAIRFSL